jgi:amino acid transporter
VLTAVLVLLLATRDVKWVARALLSLEGLAVGLIVVLLLVVTVKVAGGDAPGNQSFNWEPFTVGDAGLAAVVGSTVFGFLSWAGFEGAAALGEETRDPRRNIPRAIIFSVVLLGIFYTLTMYIQIIGFGTDAEGVAAFIDSGVTLPALADAYVGRSMATLLLAGAVVSAFASALGCTAAAARILFALARDGFGPAALSRQSASTGTPNAAAGAIVTGDGGAAGTRVPDPGRGPGDQPVLLAGHHRIAHPAGRVRHDRRGCAQAPVAVRPGQGTGLGGGHPGRQHRLPGLRLLEERPA